ncbi:MAG: lipocalin-like domain-containing protein [Bauldia sp.]
MNRLISAALALVAVPFFAQGADAQAVTKDQLVGNWHLTAAVASDAVGVTLVSRYGAKPDGYLNISGDNRATIVLVNGATPKYGALTNDVAGNIFKSVTAWAAQYQVDGAATPDGNKVTFKIDAGIDPILTGTSVAFNAKMDGGKLILKSVVPAGAITGPTTLTFEKAK